MVVERWQDVALCKGQEDLFFASDKGTAHYWKANQFCQLCQVSAYCRGSSLMEIEGFWAGTSPRDRQATRTGMGIAADRDRHIGPALNRQVDEAYEQGVDPEPFIAKVIGKKRARTVMSISDTDLKIA